LKELACGLSTRLAVAVGGRCPLPECHCQVECSACHCQRSQAWRELFVLSVNINRAEDCDAQNAGDMLGPVVVGRNVVTLDVVWLVLPKKQSQNQSQNLSRRGQPHIWDGSIVDGAPAGHGPEPSSPAPAGFDPEPGGGPDERARAIPCNSLQ
jgi:hypothetical protein